MLDLVHSVLQRVQGVLYISKKQPDEIDVATELKNPLYTEIWTKTDKWYLGPNILISQYFETEYDSKYGIFRQDAMSYMVFVIPVAELRRAVIKNMLEAGSKVITEEEIHKREDLTRLWGDRKHEFRLERPYEYIGDYEYIIVHKPTGRRVLIDYTNELRRKMIEAGVETREYCSFGMQSSILKKCAEHISDNPEVYRLGPVLKVFRDNEPDYNAKYGIFRNHPHMYEPIQGFDSNTLNEIIQHMLESGCKILTEEEIHQHRDLSRLWGDRKHEFMLQRNNGHGHPTHDYDFMILHKSSQREIFQYRNDDAKTDLIKKMMDAGVEVRQS